MPARGPFNLFGLVPQLPGTASSSCWIGSERHDATSSEEESDDEVIIQPRRSSGFRVLGGNQPVAPATSNPQQAKEAVLGQILSLANQQQTNEVVVSSPAVVEKTEQEKKALEERQRMLQQQQIAKAQQAAAIQAAAAKVAQAQHQKNGGQFNQAEMEAKEQAAREQADAERKAAEARIAQARALQVAQEQAKKAQEEALKKAQEAQAKAQSEAQQRMLAAQKAQAEAQANAQAQAQARALSLKKAQEEAQARAQAEAQARAQAAQKAQAEAKAKAQAEAQARALSVKKAQEEAQAKAQAEAQARSQALKAQKDAQIKAQNDLQAQARAQAQASAKTHASAQSQATPQQQKQQQHQNVKSAVTPSQRQPVVPSTPQKPQPPVPTAVSSKPSTGSAMVAQKKPTEMAKSSDTLHTAELQGGGATLIHHAPRPTGNKPTWNPQIKQVQQKDLGPLDKNSQLKQTAKAQEDQLTNSNGELARAAPAIVGIATAQKPAIRQENVVEKFVEKTEEDFKPQPTQRAGVQMLAGVERWEQDSAIREQQATTMGGENTEKPAAVRLQDDSCWMTQHRQPVEIQPPQIGKINIPELSEGHAIQKTVIVTKPQSYQKVKWNEFPEEVKHEIGQAPKVHTQDWAPINQDQQELQKSLYKPAKISRVWPPPEDNLTKESAPMTTVKASDDTAWIQQEQNGVLRSAAWSTAAKINRVWPPPEEDGCEKDYSGPQHMPAVQWPPSESEQHEREQVEVLQKHLPTKKIERQWPPPPPQYQEVPISQMTPGEIVVANNQDTPSSPSTAQPVNSMDFGHLLA